MIRDMLDNYILWLLPDQAGSDYFGKIITVLSEKYQTTTFIPHITIGRVPDIPLAEVRPRVKTIGQKSEPFDARIKKVWCREKSSEKISAEIYDSPHLQQILSLIDEEFEGSYGKREYPHLSLLYGDFTCPELQFETENLNHMILNRFKISSIALVALDGEPDEWKVNLRVELGY